MPTELDKHRYKSSVARHFSRAATTYNDYADFQAQVLRELTAFLPDTLQCDIATPQAALLNTEAFEARGAGAVPILIDLGAGTGSSSRALRERYGNQPHVLSMDISIDMLKKLKADSVAADVCVADFERLPVKSSSIDLFFSSLAIQWCLSVDQLFHEVSQALALNGEFVFSTLLNGSMIELEDAWRQVDQKPHINHYLSEHDILKTVERHSFEVVSFESRKITMTFPTVKQALYSLKKIGASLVVEGQKEFMSKSKWKQFVRAYEKHRIDEGIPLSYQVLFARIRKK
ncbi:malonyl-ACP O-methyltransferase BioC [Marinomonas mediterranea]|jgi:Methylase involved in ubiquinone/menaquinone biosynthesis|uniref:Malonyl-[acyl-carrier protein] O-methyltransferase n=1 Tax=Marinomonas mediterranea (strain ATCC 700492 / JCM 21426 / NBRC 103028 / MMB-1) TaxID=717774 RepID=F2K3M5_MARM1|nr:malonyl-ACP O-methyltransferase BioC [Marinomonas mediterranea]ADZ92464.1 Methyltransferase type 11 [Marinomonas mediterranea MMB-1]WCN10413.1 malonyl-ACP O-methyltransferase BioC [Marinomonas mediterranea]